MEIAVWIVTGLLAAAFVVGGAARALVPPERLAGLGLTWVTDVPVPLLKTIGVLEVAGGAGLVLPLLTGILPILAPVAACGLALVMLAGFVFHARRREWQGLPITGILFAGAVFVAVARFAGV